MQSFLFDQSPIPHDEVHFRRIARPKQSFDLAQLGRLHDPRISLKPVIVENQRKWHHISAPVLPFDPLQQTVDGLVVDRFRVCDRYHFKTDRIAGPQNAEPLPARSCRDPQAAQIRAKDEVGRIRKIDAPLVGDCFVQPWGQLEPGTDGVPPRDLDDEPDAEPVRTKTNYTEICMGRKYLMNGLDESITAIIIYTSEKKNL